MSKESILQVLDREPIRLSDGRYLEGSVDTDDLRGLIDMGDYVEVYKVNGVEFVRKNINPIVSMSKQL